MSEDAIRSVCGPKLLVRVVGNSVKRLFQSKRVCGLGSRMACQLSVRAPFAA